MAIIIALELQCNRRLGGNQCQCTPELSGTVIRITQSVGGIVASARGRGDAEI